MTNQPSSKPHTFQCHICRLAVAGLFRGSIRRKNKITMATYRFHYFQ
ncbi:Uncharacterised protein [Vibrio cholerae]|nr:Uncharacterised protein [Vibrio cholerae]